MARKNMEEKSGLRDLALEMMRTRQEATRATLDFYRMVQEWDSTDLTILTAWESAGFTQEEMFNMLEYLRRLVPKGEYAR